MKRSHVLSRFSGMATLKQFLLASAVVIASPLLSVSSSYGALPVVNWVIDPLESFVTEGSNFSINYTLSLNSGDEFIYDVANISLDPSTPLFAAGDGQDYIYDINITRDLVNTTLQDGTPYQFTITGKSNNDGQPDLLPGVWKITTIASIVDTNTQTNPFQVDAKSSFETLVTVTDTPTPEPASMLLIGVGGALMSARTLRKKKAAENSIA